MANLYVNARTGEVGITIYQVRVAMPNVSIPDGIAQIGVFRRYETVPMPEIGADQALREVPPVEGKQQWVIEQKPKADPTIESDLTIAAMRDSVLRQCDWTMLPDVDLTDDVKAVWKLYRQQLREMDCSSRSVAMICWPDVPSLK